MTKKNNEVVEVEENVETPVRTNVEVFDIMDIDPAANAEIPNFLHLVNKNTKEEMYDHLDQPIGIWLKGKEANVYRQAVYDSANRQANAKGKQKYSIENEIKKTARQLSLLGTGWEGIHSKETGESIPFSRQKFIDFMLARPYIQVQVDQFTEDESNFLG